jgi:hypothetical protein
MSSSAHEESKQKQAEDDSKQSSEIPSDMSVINYHYVCTEPPCAQKIGVVGIHHVALTCSDKACSFIGSNMPFFKNDPRRIPEHMPSAVEWLTPLNLVLLDHSLLWSNRHRLSAAQLGLLLRFLGAFKDDLAKMALKYTPMLDDLLQSRDRDRIFQHVQNRIMPVDNNALFCAVNTVAQHLSEPELLTKCREIHLWMHTMNSHAHAAFHTWDHNNNSHWQTFDLIINQCWVWVLQLQRIMRPIELECELLVPLAHDREDRGWQQGMQRNMQQFQRSLQIDVNQSHADLQGTLIETKEAWIRDAKAESAKSDRCCLCCTKSMCAIFWAAATVLLAVPALIVSSYYAANPQK